jgi:glutathione S-transferase
VQAVSNHLGIRVETEFLDFFAGDLQSPAYLAVNPVGMVPALVDGELKLWESNAIMQYLADRSGSDALFPRDSKQRADVVRWQSWELAHFNRAFGTMAFEAVAKPGFDLGTTNQALVDANREILERHARVLDQHVKGRGFVSGEGLTLADYSIIHLEGFKEQIPFDWSPFPSLNAYFERMRANAHWVATRPSSPADIGRRPAQVN